MLNFDRNKFDALDKLYQTGLIQEQMQIKAMFHIFNFTFIGAGAIVIWSINVDTLLIYRWIYLYILPVYMVVAGTAYFYACLMKGRAECYLTEIEQAIKGLVQIDDIDTWQTYKNRRNKKIFLIIIFLPQFAVYFLLPLASLVIGGLPPMIPLTDIGGPEPLNVFLMRALPWIVYIVYVVAIVFLLFENVKMRWKR